MTVANPNKLAWLEAAAQATSEQPAQRAVVLWLAEHASEGNPPRLQRLNIPAERLGFSYAEVAKAVIDLKQRAWLVKGRSLSLHIPPRWRSASVEVAA